LTYIESNVQATGKGTAMVAKLLALEPCEAEGSPEALGGKNMFPAA
jgi:hypothetical protein